MSNKLIILSEEAYEQISNKLDALLESSTANSQLVRPNTWLTSEDVLKLLDISKSTLQSYRDRMIIPFYQIGRKILYKQSEIDAYMEQFKITQQKH